MIREPGAEHLAWLDGEFVPWSAATMHISDHHYGVGVFEGVRSYASARDTHIFRLPDHTKRLLRSAKILGIRLPDGLDETRLVEVQVELVRKNRLGDAYIRPFVFHAGIAGLAPRASGLRVRVAVMALAWEDDGAFGRGHAVKQGISLRTASFTRSHANSLLTKAKANGNYMNSVLAREEARATGADDALILDGNGFVTETSGANIFAVSRGVVCTPPLDSVLDGITRDTLFTLARLLGVQTAERRLSRDDLYVADEVFLSGTAAEVTPVREIDGRPIGSGAPGPVTRQFQTEYEDLVRGRSDLRRDWLTRV